MPVKGPSMLPTSEWNRRCLPSRLTASSEFTLMTHSLRGKWVRPFVVKITLSSHHGSREDVDPVDAAWSYVVSLAYRILSKSGLQLVERTIR